MKFTMSNRLLPIAAIAALSISASISAQQPAPMPSKPDKPMAATTAPAAATASQSIDTLFKRIDTDGDGSLSKAELEKFDPEAAKSFEKYDTDKDSKLSLTEFDTMVKGLRGG
jgi:Ca2+-binding EF-hand superfamily protein